MPFIPSDDRNKFRNQNEHLNLKIDASIRPKIVSLLFSDSTEFQVHFRSSKFEPLCNGNRQGNATAAERSDLYGPKWTHATLLSILSILSSLSADLQQVVGNLKSVN